MLTPQCGQDGLREEVVNLMPPSSDFPLLFSNTSSGANEGAWGDSVWKSFALALVEQQLMFA